MVFLNIYFGVRADSITLVCQSRCPIAIYDRDIRSVDLRHHNKLYFLMIVQMGAILFYIGLAPSCSGVILAQVFQIVVCS